MSSYFDDDDDIRDYPGIPPRPLSPSLLSNSEGHQYPKGFFDSRSNNFSTPFIKNIKIKKKGEKEEDADFECDDDEILVVSDSDEGSTDEDVQYLGEQPLGSNPKKRPPPPPPPIIRHLRSSTDAQGPSSRLPCSPRGGTQVECFDIPDDIAAHSSKSRNPTRSGESLGFSSQSATGDEINGTTTSDNDSRNFEVSATAFQDNNINITFSDSSNNVGVNSNSSDAPNITIRSLPHAPGQSQRYIVSLGGNNIMELTSLVENNETTANISAPIPQPQSATIECQTGSSLRSGEPCPTRPNIEFSGLPPQLEHPQFSEPNQSCPGTSTINIEMGSGPSDRSTLSNGPLASVPTFCSDSVQHDHHKKNQRRRHSREKKYANSTRCSTCRHDSRRCTCSRSRSKNKSSKSKQRKRRSSSRSPIGSYSINIDIEMDPRTRDACSSLPEESSVSAPTLLSNPTPDAPISSHDHQTTPEPQHSGTSTTCCCNSYSSHKRPPPTSICSQCRRITPSRNINSSTDHRRKSTNGEYVPRYSNNANATASSTDGNDLKIRAAIKLLRRCDSCGIPEFCDRAAGGLHQKEKHNSKYCPVCFELLSRSGNDWKNHLNSHHHAATNDKLVEMAMCPFCDQLFDYTGIYGHICKVHFIPLEEKDNPPISKQATIRRRSTCQVRSHDQPVPPSTITSRPKNPRCPPTAKPAEEQAQLSKNLPSTSRNIQNTNLGSSNMEPSTTRNITNMPSANAPSFYFAHSSQHAQRRAILIDPQSKAGSPAQPKNPFKIPKLAKKVATSTQATPRPAVRMQETGGGGILRTQLIPTQKLNFLTDGHIEKLKRICKQRRIALGSIPSVSVLEQLSDELGVVPEKIQEWFASKVNMLRNSR